MAKTIEESNKALVLEAFDTLFNKRDYKAAERYWCAALSLDESRGYRRPHPLFHALRRVADDGLLMLPRSRSESRITHPR